MNNKKKSIFLLSAFIMSLMSVSNANAAEINISSLNKVILAKNQATESDDINSDNIIDIFDSIELRKIYMKNQSSTGEIKTDNYSATEENVKLVGRNYINKGTTWLTQSGSAVEFDVQVLLLKLHWQVTVLLIRKMHINQDMQLFLTVK